MGTVLACKGKPWGRRVPGLSVWRALITQKRYVHANNSSLRQLWRLTHVPHQGPEAGRLPIKMLKMKEPPGMCMKTKERVTQLPIISRALWPENAKVRDNRGENRMFLKGNNTRGREMFIPSFRPGPCAALDMPGRRSAPSPPPAKRGAPCPLRLMKAPAAGHPLPRGERTGEFDVCGTNPDSSLRSLEGPGLTGCGKAAKAVILRRSPARGGRSCHAGCFMY
jgi:hypothetical protein